MGDEIAVIGAGASGLAVAQALDGAGLAFRVFEQESDVGGLWRAEAAHSAVYHSAHLISSKRSTAFSDFPMPAAWPDYPHHTLVRDYLAAFADRFGLHRFITFGAQVKDVRRDGAGWRVAWDGGAGRFSAVIVANGHLWDPVTPAVPGVFNGLAIHSKDYKNPSVFDTKRVLIVGCGNSGCDIAVEAAHRARSVSLSVRSGAWFTPKFLMGRPLDATPAAGLARLLPRALKRRVAQAMLGVLYGRAERYGLPAPSCRLDEAVPVVNALVLHHIGQGDIKVRRPLARFDGADVIYAGGAREAIDVVVFCTGFRVSFPFLATDTLTWRAGAPALALNIFNPAFDGLMFAGLVEGAGGGFSLRAAQADLIAAYLKARGGAPVDAFERRALAETKARRGDDPLFVDVGAYRSVLARWTKRLSAKPRSRARGGRVQPAPA